MNQANKEKIKTGVWGAVGGAAIAMIIGFAWGGWVLGSNSMDMGEEMARNAVLDRLTPMCVAQFNQDPEKDEKLNILKQKNSWDREKYVGAQGWATMPFEGDPDIRVADRCAELILKDS